VLTEYGEVMGKTARRWIKQCQPCWQGLQSVCRPSLIDTLREQWNGLTRLDEEIAEIERRLRQWMKEDQAVNAIIAIPGVGVLTATAAVATMGDANAFRSGREFAAWVGLVPKQTGSGGKVNLLGISKSGDTYLRTLLIHGACSVLHHAKEPGPWVEQISKRRPVNVVIVALANKMARMIWAILAHERQYQKGYVSAKPA
jgi:transposase